MSEPKKWPHDINEPVHFSNHQWAVTGYGVECLESYYPFSADRLLESTDRGGVDYYDWPVHLAEKTWVEVPAFNEVFTKALEFHKGGYAGSVDSAKLDRSLQYALKIAASER